MCKSTNTQINQEENIIIGCCILLNVESQISHAYSRWTKVQQYIKNICRNKRAMKKSDFELWVLLGKRMIWYRAENLTFSGFFFLNLQKEVLNVWHSPSTLPNMVRGKKFPGDILSRYVGWVMGTVTNIQSRKGKYC